MESIKPDNGSMAEQLEEVLEMTRENNKLLKAMRRDAIVGGIVKTVIWVLLIGLSTYYSLKFIEPYLGSLQTMTSQEGAGSFDELLEQYKSLLQQ